MRERSDLWRRLDTAWLDVGLVALLLVFPFFAGVLGYTAESALDTALILPLILRRRAPVLSFTTISLALLVQATYVNTPRYGDVALLLGLYAIAAYGPEWGVWAGLGTGLLGAVIAASSWSPGTEDLKAYVTAFIVLAAVTFSAWLLGYLARTRRAYVASLEDRAAQLERDAAQQAQIATAAERARIAREMHDVVAHSLSVMDDRDCAPCSRQSHC